MKQLLLLLGMCTLFFYKCHSQTIGSTKTEQFKASFETKIDISQYLDYAGPTIPIQILKCGIGDDVYEQYPELKEKKARVEDALHATKAAAERGIVPGGGVALFHRRLAL